MLEKAKELAVTHALSGILSALGLMPTAALLMAEKELVPYVQALAPTTLLRITAVSLLFGFLSLALLVYLKPKLKFDKKLGIYLNRKTNDPYCPSCFPSRLSPLKETEHGWQCMVKDCKFSIRHPDHKISANDFRVM